MRARQRAPSQCNVHLRIQTVPLFLFLFLHETNNLPKGKNYSRKNKTKQQKNRSEKTLRTCELVTVTSWLILSPLVLPQRCVFFPLHRGTWGVLRKNKDFIWETMTSSCHFLHSSYFLFFFFNRGTTAVELNAFFFPDGARKTRKTTRLSHASHSCNHAGFCL